MLLVLDEPFAALDPVARDDFLASVAEAARDSGISVVLSSHVLAELAFNNWLAGHGYTSWTRLQPDSRFWEFQLIEGTWLLALSAAVIGGTVWLVRRRGA